LKFIDFLRDMFGSKETVYVKQRLESEKYKLDIENFSVQMAINMLAGLIAKCEFKTYIKGGETKADEYYLWNVEPNDNQNSSQFLQELVSKLLYDNEALIVEVNGKLLIADSFSQTEYAIYPNTFTGVACGDFTFDKTFYMPDVLYFKLNNKNIRALLSGLMSGYSQLLDMAIGKYKRAGGRKGVAKINKTNSGDKKYQEQIDDLFGRQFKTYFDAENAVVHMPNGVEYQEITGEGSKKSTSEINDIANITKEAMSRVAQAFRIPPALLQGDIADVSKLIDQLLTFCIDPLADLLQTEINRKRYGKAAFIAGSCLKIDTTCVKHIDIFSVAEQADKLISDGLYSADELRVKLGDMPLGTWWSKRYVRTKNYEALPATEPPADNSTTGGETDETNVDNQAAGAKP
jgi:HK97 family phage portal protein